MQIGIVGLPFSGKSTLFSTILERKNDEDEIKHKLDTERGIVKVPDSRLDDLMQIFKPKRKVNTTIEYVKVPGFESDIRQGKGLPAQFLANIKTVDEILLLIRHFENDLFPHPLQSVDPLRDIKYIESEFILSDLSIVESRISKLEKLVHKTQSEKDKKELAVLKKCLPHLENEKHLYELKFNDQEELILRGFQFLTSKPILYVLNISEDKIKVSDEIIEKYRQHIHPGNKIIALSVEIEKEISQLEADDARLFLEDLGITENAMDKLIHASYDLLNLHSFYTFGESECRCWTIPKGTNVHRAAGIIHSDMQRGFIRAEVVPYTTLVEHGNIHSCKEKGLLRLEGKDYIVQDGDIITIRFNV